MKNSVKEIPQGYKDSPLGIIPQDWEVKRLGEISTMFSGGTPLSTQPLYYGGDIPFIKSGEILASCTEQTLTKLGYDSCSAKMVNKGDLLYALYGATSGQCAISKISGAINQAVLCIRPQANVYYIASILQLYKDLYYNSFLQGGQGNLSADIVKKYYIPIPPIEQQQKIVEVLSTWDLAIELEKNKLTKLQLEKKGLMQQLLTGKKIVSV